MNSIDNFPVMQEETLKEKFDRAFYNLLESGNRLQELSHKIEYASNLIKLNKLKQREVEELLNVNK